RDVGDLDVIARLRPGVSLEQAQAEMDTISANLAAAHPETNNVLYVRVVPLRDQVLGGSRRVLLLLFAGTGLVLLIACGNVANLLLARATTRQKEVAIRAALGAGRRRIIRQVLTEAVLLSLLGGAFGVLLAFWGTELLLALRPANLPRLQDVHMDGTVFLFCFGACIFTGILF